MVPALVLSILAGCGSPAAICDGTGRVRLAAYVAGGFVVERIRPEVGFRFFYVDGHCNYAVNSGAPLDPSRGGTLNATSASELSERLDYGHWPARAGTYGGAVLDGSVNVFDSGSLETPDILCDACLPGTTAVDDVLRGFDAALTDLDSRGRELDGGVRYLVWGPTVGAPSGTIVDASAVPLDLAAIAIPFVALDVVPHDSRTGQEAAALRSLRHAAAAVPHNSGIYAQDAHGAVFMIEMRDVLPMEGPDHHVRLR